MLHYLYDGTFEGLMTAVHEAYYRRQVPEAVTWDDHLQENILDCYTTIETDPVKADKVIRSIREKISEEALENAFHAYLSDIEDIGVWIYRYLRLGFKAGAAVDSFLWEDPVIRIAEVTRKVRFESHRMLGLIRFRALESGVYYAPIGPDHNILSLIAPHFARRLADQQWMIHDVKRDTAALYNGKDWTVVMIRQKKALNLHGDEVAFQRLWKQYFAGIAIAGRKNPRLQRQHMPSRYWRYLVEK